MFFYNMHSVIYYTVLAPCSFISKTAWISETYLSYNYASSNISLVIINTDGGILFKKALYVFQMPSGYCTSSAIKKEKKKISWKQNNDLKHFQYLQINRWSTLIHLMGNFAYPCSALCLSILSFLKFRTASINVDYFPLRIVVLLPIRLLKSS